MNSTSLKRELGVTGAVTLGLGSMLGSGVFVSIGLAENMVEGMVLPAILLAAIVAACNGLSSAQLAAAHSRAGGTYEYGHVYIHPIAGFSAGTMFLLAKSASAATAALAFGEYSSRLVNVPIAAGLLPFIVILLLTGLVLTGLRRSNAMNAVIVLGVTGVLSAFIVTGLSSATKMPTFDLEARSFLHATALLFVAFTGYGRIATLAEEVRNPRRTIPLSIAITVVVISVLYLCVGAVLTLHPVTQQADGAPLAVAASVYGSGSWLVVLISFGAIVALLGVMLNLILGLSRVLLAMGRRGDVPVYFGKLDASSEPKRAIIATGLGIAGLCLIGDVRVAWTLSAVAVLIYYGITNWAALRLPRDQRYPRAIAWIGLVGCLGLSAFVPAVYWAWSIAVLTLAFAIRGMVHSATSSNEDHARP